MLEERFPIMWEGGLQWVYASDHLPMVADVQLPPWRRKLKKRLKAKRPKGVAPPKQKVSKLLFVCLAVLIAIAIFLLGIFGWMIFDKISIDCTSET